MVAKKKSVRKKQTKVKKIASKKVVRKVDNSMDLKKRDIKRRIMVVLKNMILFSVLFVLSFVLYNASEDIFYLNLFLLLSIIFAFVFVAFVIVLLVFLFLKLMNK